MNEEVWFVVDYLFWWVVYELGDIGCDGGFFWFVLEVDFDVLFIEWSEGFIVEV